MIMSMGMGKYGMGIYLCMYLNMYLCMGVWVCVYVCMCMCMSMTLCMYMCRYMFYTCFIHVSCMFYVSFPSFPLFLPFSFSPHLLSQSRVRLPRRHPRHPLAPRRNRPPRQSPHRHPPRSPLTRRHLYYFHQYCFCPPTPPRDAPEQPNRADFCLRHR